MFPISPHRPPRRANFDRPRQQRMIQPYEQRTQPQEAPLQTKLMSIVQSPNGQLDFEKISNTVQQMSQLYGQFSPLLTNFRKLINR